MRQILGLVGATIISALPSAIYFGVEGESLKLGVITFVLASLWIMLLGLPAYLGFRTLGWIRWWTTTLAGFVLGVVPIAIFAWPYRPGTDSSYSASDGHGMVDYIVHGVPTHAGWVSYLHSTGAIGLIGAASAFVFWLALTLIAGHRKGSG